jgi:flagellar motility protein MotE (MotC chaperone)
MQAQDTTGKKGHRSLVIGHWLRIFLIFLFFTTYHLSPITHYPLSVFAQQPVQQKSLEEERLNIIRADIQKKIEQLEKLKIEIEAAQKALQKAQEEELLKIVKIYEAMPPEEAARKLEALSEDMAVLILISLKPRTAGRVMAQMDTEKAASISKKMLERATEKTSR